eukprot:3099656-Karenia_brevis.AAC.1
MRSHFTCIDQHQDGPGKGQDSQFVIWNLHRHNISAADRDRVLQRISEDADRAKQNPTHFILAVVGDFNFYDVEDSVEFTDPIKQRTHESEE